LKHDPPTTTRGKQRTILRIFWHPLAVTFVLAFVLRAAPNVYMQWTKPGQHPGNIEQLEFYVDDVARSLIAGGGFVHSINPRPGCPYHFEPGTPYDFEPPLYAWWLGLVYFVFGPNIFLARILQCLMDSCTCLLLYVLARRITGDRKTALLSALLYAVYPLAIFICLGLYYQVPMNLALIWLILCMMAPVTWRNGLWAGLAVAVSALAKPVTLPLIALLPAVKLAESLWGKITWKACLLWCLCFTAASLGALAPWTVRNYLVFHGFVPVQNGASSPLMLGSKEEYIDLDCINVYKEYGSEMDVPPDAGVRTAVNNHWEHWKRAPFDYLRFLAKKFLLTWYNTEGKGSNSRVLLVQIPFLALAILGLVCVPRLWFKDGNWYVPAIVLYICAVQVAFLPFVRYTLAAMPLVMLIGGVGGTWLIRRMATSKEEVIS
jgi:4-amino-4-deoxy-L-arabinose transferase-like glycosyltransferase